MVPLFVLDRKFSLLSAMDKVSSTTSPRLLSKSAKADQELVKCLEESATREVLLKSYVCARHKDILVQGRLLLTENYICFYSNIIGWETKTSIHLKDVTAILKQKTALIIPNAIQIETEKKKYVFSSFMHRDRVHQVMVAVWENYKLCKPLLGESLRQSLGKRDKLSKANLKNSSVGVTSTDPASNSAAAGNYQLDNSIVTSSTLSSEEGSSDWTDASLEMESSGDECAHAIRDGNAREIKERSFTRSFKDSTSTCASRESMSRSNSSHSNASNASIVSLCSSSSFVSDTEQDGRTQSSLSDRSISPLMTTPTQIDTPDGGSGWKDNWRCLCLQYIQRISSSTTFINFFILVVVLVLLVTLLSMVCRLCQLEPSLHMYLSWQPWCPCLSPHTSSTPTLLPAPR